jgi:hypothetical protein
MQAILGRVIIFLNSIHLYRALLPEVNQWKREEPESF